MFEHRNMSLYALSHVEGSTNRDVHERNRKPLTILMLETVKCETARSTYLGFTAMAAIDVRMTGKHIIAGELRLLAEMRKRSVALGGVFQARRLPVAGPIAGAAGVSHLGVARV